jgi:DNA-binding GntR family transcriptional regulator
MASKELDKKQETDLTYKAYSEIRRMLFYNEIQPGQKIRYKSLANQIGVSMTPVIQALKWLEFRNIVRHETNKGYYINKISLKEITEVYDTRLLIEISLIPTIIRNLDNNGIKKIEKAYECYKTAVIRNKYHKRMHTDMQFHMTLASLSECIIQLKMLDELFDVLLLRYNRNLLFLSVMDSSLKEHSEILDALERRDEHLLSTTLFGHITHVREHIIKGMGQFTDKDGESLPDSYLF